MRATLLFLPRNSAFHRWHPMTKLALSSLALVAAAALPGLPWLLSAFVVLATLAAWGRIFPPYLKACWAIMWPFFVSLILIQGFFTDGQTTLLALGPFAFTLEGALAGVTAGARILVALGGAMLLMQATRPDALMLALEQRGLPDSLAYIVLSALQIFPRFQDRAQVILDAQQSRGLETQVAWWRRPALLLPMTVPLVLSSVVEVEERAMALEARAFSRPGRKTSLLVLEDDAGQRALRWLLVLLALSLVALRVAGLLA